MLTLLLALLINAGTATAPTSTSDSGTATTNGGTATWTVGKNG